MPLRANNRNSLTRIFGVQGQAVHVPSDRFIIPSQLVGVEVEIENCPSFPTPSSWVVHDDGSLRSGIEFTTDGPQCGEAIYSAVNSLFTSITDGGGTMARCSSFRTSIHVHMDFSRSAEYPDLGASDSYYSAQLVVLSYYALEDLFYRFAGEARARSGYCFPFTYIEHDLLHFLADSRGAAPTISARYYGCNFVSLRTHGTLEFRHLGLTLDTDRVIKWINILMRLKRYTYLHYLSGDRDLLDNPEDARNLAEYVFAEAPEVLTAFNQSAITERLDRLAGLLGVQESTDVATVDSLESGAPELATPSTGEWAAPSTSALDILARDPVQDRIAQLDSAWLGMQGATPPRATRRR